MRRIFEDPEIQIVHFSLEDVITTSSTDFPDPVEPPITNPSEDTGWRP